MIHRKCSKHWRFRENYIFNKMSKNRKNKNLDDILECKKFDGLT